MRSKKPNGLSQNETISEGITGQSSGRVMWWMTNTYRGAFVVRKARLRFDGAEAGADASARPSGAASGTCVGEGGADGAGERGDVEGGPGVDAYE